MDGKICLEMEFKVLCYLHFLKNKICSDRTKSLQIIDKFNIISKKKKKKSFRWDGVLLFDFTLLSTML